MYIIWNKYCGTYMYNMEHATGITWNMYIYIYIYNLEYIYIYYGYIVCMCMYIYIYMEYEQTDEKHVSV